MTIYYRLVYSDNSVSAWTTDFEKIQKLAKIFNAAIMTKTC